MKKFVAYLLTGSMLWSNAMPALAAGNEHVESGGLPVQEESAQDNGVENSVDVSKDMADLTQGVEDDTTFAEEEASETVTETSQQVTTEEMTQEEKQEETEQLSQEHVKKTEAEESMEEAEGLAADLPQTGRVTTEEMTQEEKQEETEQLSQEHVKKTEAEESMEEAEGLAADLPQTGSLSVVIYPALEHREETEQLSQEHVKKTEAEESMEEAEGLAADLPQTGSLSVVIYPALEHRKDVSFTLSLDGKDEQTIILPATGGELLSETSVIFENLNGEAHTLEIKAQGFGTYTQVIPEGNYDYSMQVYTGIQGIYHRPEACQL